MHKFTCLGMKWSVAEDSDTTCNTHPPGSLQSGAHLRGCAATQHSKKCSEKVLGRVLGKGSQKGFEKGCYVPLRENLREF